MARSRRRREGRVTSVNANGQLPLRKRYVSQSPFDYQAIQDRRRFNPEGDDVGVRVFKENRSEAIVERYRRRRVRKQTRVGRVDSSVRSMWPVQSFKAFAEPEAVTVCVRRKQRREVIFASGRGGRRGQRPPRFNWRSKIQCRRK